MSLGFNEYIEIEDDQILAHINSLKNSELISEIKSELKSEIVSSTSDFAGVKSKEGSAITGEFQTIKIELNSNSVRILKALANKYEFNIHQN